MSYRPVGFAFSFSMCLVREPPVVGCERQQEHSPSGPNNDEHTAGRRAGHVPSTLLADIVGDLPGGSFV